MPSTTSRGQFDGQWEGVTRPAIGNGAEQGALQDPEHINVANYGTADYPGQPGVSELCVMYQSSYELTTLLGHQDPAVPYMTHNVGLAQDILEHENVNFPVCDNVSFP